MASIKEAYDSTIGESFTGLKMLLWAIPLTICRDWINTGGISSFVPFCIAAIFLLLLLGFVAEAANNAMEKKPVLVPGINIFTFGINGLKTIFGISIYTAIAYFAATMACSYIHLDSDVLTQGIHILIWLFALSFPITGFMMFVRKLDLFEAYNLKHLFSVVGDVFIMFSYLLIKLGILTGIVIGFISYLFWMFVGLDNYLINYIWSIAIMYNLIIGTNYIAQFGEETTEIYTKKEATQGAKLY